MPAIQNYLEHEFFVAMQRNPDDPLGEFLDPRIFPSHQIDNYFPEVMKIASGYFGLERAYELRRKYEMKREKAIA